MTAPNTQTPASPALLPLIFVMGLYYAVHAAIRVQAPGNVTLDESEQMLMARWFQWGYSPQPPLYTWLQAALFRVMGESVAALTLLRNALQLVVFVGFHLIARREFGDRTRTVLASVSLLLILEFVWDNQRERTHSLLALAIAVMQFRVLLSLIDRPRLTVYLISGVLAAAGMLSKYNYALYLFALCIALISRPTLRARLLDGRTLLSAAVALALLAPHLHWLQQHPFVAGALGDKLDTAGRTGALHAAGLVLVTIGSFLSPFWLVCLLIFPSAWRGLLTGRQAVSTVFPYPVFLGAMTVMLLAVAVGMDLDRIRERWMQPLLFLFPIAFFACVAHGSLTPRRRQLFLGAAALAALLALAGQAWRVAPPTFKTHMTRLDHPMGEIATALQQSGLPLQTIVTDDYYLAGSLRLHLPHSQLHTANPTLRLPRPASGQPALLLWESADAGPPAEALLSRVHQSTGCTLDADAPGEPAIGPRVQVRYGKHRAATYSVRTARLRC
jgi:4-amino-4-deoxy-L-arabinose transferase-like glycosyltransferase